MKTYTMMTNLLVGTKVIPSGTVFTEDNVPKAVLAEVKAKTKSVKVTEVKPAAITDIKKLLDNAESAVFNAEESVAETKKALDEATEFVAGLAKNTPLATKKAASDKVDEAKEAHDGKVAILETAERALSELKEGK